MSIAMMAEVWRREIVATEQQVLLVLCDHVQDDGTNCYPSVPLVAWKIGVSDRTVRRTIKTLEAKGVLEVIRKDGKSNTYRINLDALPPKEPFRRKVATPDIAVSPRQDVTPDTAMSPHPGHSYVTPTPDIAVSPKPSGEPSKNRQGRKRPTQVPDEFPITDELAAWGTGNGFTVWQMESQVESFQDHYRAKGEARLDWIASFRTWMKKARTWNQLPASPPGHQHRSMNPADYGYHGSEGLKQFKAALERGEIAP